MPADIIIQNQPVQPGKKYIKVNTPGIKKTAGSTIVFKNALPGNPEARLTFYKMDAKGGTAISDFCQGQTTSYFTVPSTGNGEASCKLAKTGGNFAYSISTHPPTYETLDPIIIIEPHSQYGLAKQDSNVVVTALIGALIGAAVMFVLLKTVFGKRNQAG